MRGFLRTTERPGDSEEIRGIRVARWSKRLGVGGQQEPTVVPGQVWVFPGSDRQVALVLVAANLGDDVLRDPTVSVEYGVRDRGAWVCDPDGVIKAHNLS